MSATIPITREQALADVVEWGYLIGYVRGESVELTTRHMAQLLRLIGITTEETIAVMISASERLPK